jgi:N,N'-diacetyllegionaminate synthase
MLINGFDTDRKVLVIAEIGNNHEGRVEAAEAMVRSAAAAGVDAVKFQTFKTEHYVSASDKARFDRLKRFELTGADFTRLAGLARELGLLFISTPFDLESAAFLNGLVSAFKIASGDNTFIPLIEAVARTGKPVLLSCGIASLDELRYAQAVIRRTWNEAGAGQKLAALHCVSSYPVPRHEANLAAIGRLRAELGCTVGYSDHTLGIEAAVLAVAAGARIVEKHFTLDKNTSDFRDHQLSADPPEMAELVRRIREAESFLGDGRKQRQPSEEAAATALRRSIVARRDLPAGTPLSWADITWVRPGGGIAPGGEIALLGRVLKVPVASGQRITLDLIEERSS